MKCTDRLKERFAKECGLPIGIFQEPYFMDRLVLYDHYYDSKRKWNTFADSVLNNPKYSSEQDYFEEYNRVKDNAISAIQGSPGYARFMSIDMKEFEVYPYHKQLRTNDIYSPSFVDGLFISIDMQKANYTSLKRYDPNIFGCLDTWEAFLAQFTDVSHILNSKYIRQVIMGNCCPKRNIAYAHRHMSYVLEELSVEYGSRDKFLEYVCSFASDEIVLQLPGWSGAMSFRSSVENTCRSYLPSLSLKVQLFTLHKIEGYPGYYKKIYDYDSSSKIELKCVDSYNLPFIIRKLRGQEVEESDKVFVFQGRLAQFID